MRSMAKWRGGRIEFILDLTGARRPYGPSSLLGDPSRYYTCDLRERLDFHPVDCQRMRMRQITSGIRPPEHLVIFQTEDWILSHRVDSALPGYLILGARMPTNNLSFMRPEALAQLGTLLACSQKALTTVLNPKYLYMSRYGHMAGCALHFHLIPVCEWVMQCFFREPRYHVVRELSCRSAAAGVEETDGAELTLYIWREFCDGPTARSISGPSIKEVVERLKVLMSGSMTDLGTSTRSAGVPTGSDQDPGVSPRGGPDLTAADLG